MISHDQIVVNYRFKVLIDNYDVSFAKVTGIGMDAQMENIAEGGRNAGNYITSTVLNNAKTMHLETGVCKNSGNVLSRLRPGMMLNQGIVIMVMGYGGNIDVKYATDAALVTKWEVAALDAKQGEILIDTFEVAYSRLWLMN